MGEYLNNVQLQQEGEGPRTNIYKVLFVSMFSSSNAYMLSYTKRAIKPDGTAITPPDAALSNVIMDNDVFQSEVDACLSL